MLEQKISRTKHSDDYPMEYYFGLAAITLATAADTGLTALNIQQHGTMYEANPILRNIIENAGICAGLVIPKGLVALGLVEITKKCYEVQKRKVGNFIIYGSSSLWSVGALSNLAVAIHSYNNGVF